MRRVGAPIYIILTAQNNLASTYQRLGQPAKALRILQEVCSGALNQFGEEDKRTLSATNNLAASLRDLRRFEEAKSLLRKAMPVAQRAFGEGDRHIVSRRCSTKTTEPRSTISARP